MAAQAGSGESVYEPEVPSVHSETSEVEKSSGHLKPSPLENKQKAEGSDAPEIGGESSSEPEGETGTESEGKSHQEGGGVPSGGGGKNPPSSGGEAPGQSKGGGSEVGIGEGKKLVTAQTGEPATADDSSSSPVLPILIAVAVLAAISIGVVLYRQRKSGQGPDGRGSVSSSNAS